MSMPAPPTPLQVSYLDPDGNSWNLSDTSMSSGFVCSAISGIEGLPVSIQTIPMLDGTAVPNFYLPQPGSIILAILVGWPTPNESDYYALLDKVVRAFYNRRQELPAPGSIVIQRPDGTSRQINVLTTSGLDNPQVGLHNCLYTLTLQTPDPYWTDAITQNLIYKLNVAAGILPLLPVALTAGTILGNTVITTNGNALCWPTWTITGPGTPTIKNLTTGRQWSLNTPIPAGNVVQVTTKPGTQIAVNQTTGANIWDQLVLSSLRDLWPLMSGSNQVSIAMSGATASTAVQVSWVNRWNRA